MTPAQQAVLDLYRSERRAGESRIAAATSVRATLACDAMRTAQLHDRRVSREAADRFRVADQFVTQVIYSELARWAKPRGLVGAA